MKDLVSVVIPVYNSKKWLQKCIYSILNQTYSNLELIIIDDGSTENICDVINQINDKRITLINKHNEGVSTSRNLGINISKGKYIYFLDSDDYVEDNLIEICMKEFRNESNLDIVYFNFFNDLHSETDEFVSTNISNFKDLELKEDPLLFAGFVWNKMYKVKFLKENNILFNPNLNIYEDIDYNLRCLLLNPYIRYIDKTLYHYINRPKKSLIKNYTEQNLVTFNLVKDSLISFLKFSRLNKDKSNLITTKFIFNCIRYQLDTIYKYADLTFNERTSAIKNVFLKIEDLEYLYTYRADNLKMDLILKVIKTKNPFIINIFFTIIK